MSELHRKDVETFKSAKKIPVCVVLDSVRSMNNVGSVFRTCDAFLVEKIYLCGITGQPPHREIQKTALGATETVDWEYGSDIKSVLQSLKAGGYLICGIEQTDESIALSRFSIQKDERYALIFGNEVEGISDEIMPALDAAIEIPQLGVKHSLNVSVAAGIVLYRFFETFIL